MALKTIIVFLAFIILASLAVAEDGIVSCTSVLAGNSCLASDARSFG